MALNWPGSGSAVSGSTSFGLYDNDAQFQLDAPKVAVWCARRLGYPIQDVELLDVHFYACFEEAISEYAAQVNQYNIRNNYLSLKGSPTGSSVTHKNITPSVVPTLIRLSADYGGEIGVGGNVDWKSGSIEVTSGSQVYDLTQFAAVSASGKEIEIKRIFHEGAPSISRFYDPFSAMGTGYLNMLNEFGFSAYSPAVKFLMMPMYEDLLRLQAIEFNDLIRKSAYSFELINNKLRIFPKPVQSYRLHFQYILAEDRNNIATSTAASGVSSDYSNIPYQAMEYRFINEVGKQWIRKYTLALSKETLGAIRQKFATIPIPNSEIQLDGDALRAEAQVEKDALIEQLRETLEEVSMKNQMQSASDQADQLQSQLTKIPLKIYIM